MPVIKWGVSSGIRRDGPSLDDNGCLDGNWMRFTKRGNPSPMGGFQHISGKSTLITDKADDSILFDKKIKQTIIFQDSSVVTPIQTVDAISDLVDRTVTTGSDFVSVPVKSRLVLKLLSAITGSTITVSFSGSGKSDSLNIDSIGGTSVTSNDYFGVLSLHYSPSLLTTFAHIIIACQDVNILKQEKALKYASLVKISSDKNAPRDISFVVTGTKVNEDKTNSLLYSETVIMKENELTVVTKSSFSRLTSIVALGSYPSGLKFTAEQKNIILINSTKSLDTPSSLFLLSSGMAGVSTKVKAVDYVNDTNIYYDMISNDSMTQDQAVYSQGIYFSEVSNIILTDYPPQKTISLTFGTREYFLIKNKDIGSPSQIKITTNAVQDLTDKKIAFVGYDENNDNKSEILNLSASITTSTTFLYLTSVVIPGFVANGKDVSLQIFLPTISVLRNTYVTPSNKLTLVNKGNSNLTFTFSYKCRNSTGSEGQSSIDYVVAQGQSRTTDISYSYIDSITIDKYSEFAIYTASDLSHSAFRSIPRSCLLTPNLETSNSWLLIVGFTALDPNSSSNKQKYGDLVQLVKLDSNELVSVGLPQSILSDKVAITYDNPADVDWSFDTFSTKNTVMLIACQLNSLHNIGGNNKACPILIDSLKPASSIKLSPLSLKDGVSKSASDPDDCLYTSGGVLTVYPYLFIYNYASWSPVEKQPLNITGSIAYTTVEMRPDESGSILKQVQVVASSNIVHGESVRGGGAPGALFWSLDSLIRASFQQNPSNPFSFEVVSEGISIISSKSVVEYNGLFFWIGVDCFYLFQGSVSVVQNLFNQEFFFNNVDMNERQKIWGTLINGDEIMWHYPNKNLPGYQGECNAYLLYNVTTQVWSDGYFPVTQIDQPDFNPIHDSDPIYEKISKGRSCGIKDLKGFSYPIAFDNTISQNIFIKDNTDSAYRAFFHEKGYDQVFPSSFLYNKQNKQAPILSPIYSYIHSNIMSCFLGKNAVDEQVSTQITNVAFNISGKGNLKLDFYSSSGINSQKIKNPGKRYQNIDNADPSKTYPSYDIFLEDDTAICLPQNLSGVAENALTLRQTPLSFPADGRVIVITDKQDNWDGTSITVKGKYGKKLVTKEETVAFNNGFFLKNLLRQIDSIKVTNALGKFFTISIGFYPPTAQDIIDQSKEASKGAGANELESMNDQSLFFSQKINEKGEYLTFVINKYNINGFFELGQSLFTIKSGGGAA